MNSNQLKQVLACNEAAVFLSNIIASEHGSSSIVTTSIQKKSKNGNKKLYITRDMIPKAIFDIFNAEFRPAIKSAAGVVEISHSSLEADETSGDYEIVEDIVLSKKVHTPSRNAVLILNGVSVQSFNQSIGAIRQVAQKATLAQRSRRTSNMQQKRPCRQKISLEQKELDLA